MSKTKYSDRRSAPRSNDGQFTLSYKTIGALGSILLIAGTLFAGMRSLATKDDVNALATKYDTTYSSIEKRVWNLEIQFASLFGKNATGSPALLHPSTSEPHHAPVLIRTQAAQYPEASANAPAMPRWQRQKRVVITYEFIKGHELHPTPGGAYALLGEDGNDYSIDDVIAILIREHQEQYHPQMKMKK